MVEFALTLPIFITILAVALQFSILLTAQVGVMWVTNELARWVATGTPERWFFRDSCHDTYRNNMVASFPLLRSANVIVPAAPNYISPANTSGFNTPCYTTVPYSFPVPPAMQPSQPVGRTRGTPIKVTLRYNPSNLMFIPTTFFGAAVLNSLPAYTATSVME